MNPLSTVNFFPSEVSIICARAELLTQTLNLACAKLKARGFLYPAEVRTLIRVTGDVNAQLAEALASSGAETEANHGH
jgi:hypothetical protein